MAVWEVFHRHTDTIEPLSLNEAYLDVTATKQVSRHATLLAKVIRQQIWDELNLTASAGVAPIDPSRPHLVVCSITGQILSFGSKLEHSALPFVADETRPTVKSEDTDQTSSQEKQT